jgi:uncharacterized protein DUF6894
MRYYFHVKDGHTILDQDGKEFSDIEHVKANAVRSSGEMLRDLNHQDFWVGEPWKLWVTDGPGGTGKTLLELNFVGTLP